MVAPAAIKMDELLVNWLGSDAVYENVLEWIENYRRQQQQQQQQQSSSSSSSDENNNNKDEQQHNNNEHQQKKSSFLSIKDGGDEANNSNKNEEEEETIAATTTAASAESSIVTTTGGGSNTSNNTSNSSSSIPPFYPIGQQQPAKRRTPVLPQHDTWDGGDTTTTTITNNAAEQQQGQGRGTVTAREAALAIFHELGEENNNHSSNNVQQLFLSPDAFVRITKEVCRFPSYFNLPLYQRILYTWNSAHNDDENNETREVVDMELLEYYWKNEMEPYDEHDRFFRLVKQSDSDHIVRDDFLPFIKALLSDHPGLEFLANHAEFQEKYAVTVITRIFYCVNACHSGRITARQIRRSDLLASFQQVDEEEDINKVTRYFSYEHFYVLYCRFWELDHDRDYRINRDDLLKYGDHSLSHMIVDRIFDAAPRPFESEKPNREYLSYEDFIYFMLSEEDKSNETSVRYWFTCVDVDGDGKLNNMEMRSFYAVQLHRMQCMGHEIVPFEDMLCQMMDMIKPANMQHLVVSDFLQSECCQVSGALFDALFNLNKYLLFEQRDPFAERQKREDEFECDWDRFACIDYNRLALEEEAREEEAMEIDWVTVDDEEEEEDEDGNFAAAAGAHQQQQQEGGAGPSSEAPF